MSELRFSPAVDGGGSARPPIEAKQFYFPEEYCQLKGGEEHKYDIDVIELEQELDEMFGYLGIDTRKENAEGVEKVEVCGYPADKKMWHAVGSF